MAENAKLTISDLEHASGIPRSTIHHYVREGLLHPPDKTGQTMAYYDQIHLDKLKTIHAIKKDYLDTRKSSRVPLDYIKHRLGETGASGKTRGKTAPSSSAKDDERSKRKLEIIEAAINAYAKRGYYQTRVKDVVKEAGISMPTFYYYFTDKRELFVEAIEHVIRDFGKEIVKSIDEEQDIRKTPYIMFKIFYENYGKIGEILNQLRAGAIVGDQWAREKLTGVYQELGKLLTRELERYMEIGYVRKMSPDLLAFFILAIAEAEINRASMDDKYSIVELALFGADLQYNGFLTDEGRKAFGIENLQKETRK